MGSPQLVLLDTHAWLWWLLEPDRLGARAATSIDAALEAGTLRAATISAWEAATLEAKGRLRTTHGVASLVVACESMQPFAFVPLTAAVAAEAGSLENFHGDPADRMIVATALYQDALLITKDRKITDYAAVKTAW